MSGVGLVVWGWAVVGMLVETYGFWLLFAGFVPTALSFLRRVPVFGRLLDLPMFKRVRICPAAMSLCMLKGWDIWCALWAVATCHQRSMVCLSHAGAQRHCTSADITYLSRAPATLHFCEEGVCRLHAKLWPNLSALIKMESCILGAGKGSPAKRKVNELRQHGCLFPAL